MKNIVIDVREPMEYASGHVEGAINIPPASLLAGAKEIADVSKDAPLVLYCRSGSRSQTAINILQQLGFTNLTNGISQQNVEKNYLQ